MGNTISEDRRRFFRIDDSIGIRYQPLEAASLAPVSVTQNQGGIVGKKDVLVELAECNKTLEVLLSQLAAQNDLAAEIVQTLDNKINCVIRELDLEAKIEQRFFHDIKHVNISACGLALHLEELLAADTVLDLELLLLPSQLLLRCIGVVIDASQDSSDHYFTRINFQAIEPNDQELLIQYLVRRQGALLKASRDESLNDN